MKGRALSVVGREVGGGRAEEAVPQHRDCCLVQHEVSHLAGGGSVGWGRETGEQTCTRSCDSTDAGCYPCWPAYLAHRAVVCWVTQQDAIGIRQLEGLHNVVI